MENLPPPDLGKFNKLKTLIRAYWRADFMLDISGFELSSKLGVYPSLRYLFKIALSKVSGTKVFLMPQSYGPFSYGGWKQRMMTMLIKAIMPYPKVCYAREEESYVCLKQIAPKARVVKSLDLVLQNKPIEEYFKDKAISLPCSVPPNSVALIPNGRLSSQFGADVANLIMSSSVKLLRRTGKNVYIICHCKDDLKQAKKIKSEFEDDGQVIVIDRILACYEYQSIVRYFDYIVAARYHSIVHAYKECTPVIAIGWAVKYKELLEEFSQEDYLIDASIGDKAIGLLEAAVMQMSKAHKAESAKIGEHLKEVQSKNCFDALDDGR